MSTQSQRLLDSKIRDLLFTTVGYTTEEANWVSNKFRKMDEAFEKVPVNEEVVRQFAMFSLGVFPGRRILPQLLRTFFERVWKVLEIHDEFDRLTTRQQRDILMRNCQAGMALMFIKHERLVSFKHEPENKSVSN